MQKVVISILHYNNDRDTISCLDSLKELDLTNIEVSTYVLDNGSREKLAVDTKNYSRINLSILTNSQNSGFTGGHNLIFEKVKNLDFDYFLLLNNDTIVETNLLLQLLKVCDKKSIGAVVPKIYFTKGHEYHKERYHENELGRVFWYAGGAMDWDHVMSRHKGVDEVDNGQFGEVMEIDFATGACLLISKELIKKIGLFDERYFLYYEDADLSQRILKSNHKILYNPKAILWHNNAGSSSSGSELHDYYLTRNRMLFGMAYSPLKIKLFLIKESIGFLKKGRKWQKIGIKDYYLRRFGKGSYK